MKGDSLDNVTISEERAKSIVKGLFDASALGHTLAVGKIARDERLVSFSDGFMERNKIEVLTIGYIDSENFWPKILGNSNLKKIEKSGSDNLLAAKVIFHPQEEADLTQGYQVALELTGKTSTVYELLSLDGPALDSIAEQARREHLGDATYPNPTQAKETVVNALIAALERVEANAAQVEAEEQNNATLAAVRKALVKEALEGAMSNIERWQQANGASNGEAQAHPLYECFSGRESSVEALLANIARHAEAVDDLVALLESDEPAFAALKDVSQQVVKQGAPYFDKLAEEKQLDLITLICPYLVDGVEEDLLRFVSPLKVSLEDIFYLTEPDKSEFFDRDTIRIHSYMSGVALQVEDAENNVIELLPQNFPYVEGVSWSPGYIVNVEQLEENEVKAVEIVISGADKLTVYIEKPSAEVEMTDSDVLGLLSDISKASKNKEATFDLFSRLSSYGFGEIKGSLSKKKVNEKYEVDQLQLKVSKDSETKVSLQDVEVEFVDGADKSVEMATLKFKAVGTKNNVLELTVLKKDHPFLEWFLLAKKPIFKITTTKVTDDNYSTVSSFTINQGTFSGYFLERPAGTATQERTSGSYKRVPEGDYKMCYTYKSCRQETTRSNAHNETWLKTYGIADNDGFIISREYILIHTGNYPWNSAGCLLIGGSYSDYTLDEEIKEDETGIEYEEGLVVKMVSNSGDKLTALNNEYKKLIDLTKKFDDTCTTNKCYELEIDINR